MSTIEEPSNRVFILQVNTYYYDPEYEKNNGVVTIETPHRTIETKVQFS